LADEPFESVLAAAWAGEEQSLELVTVEVAVLVQCEQDRQVSRCERPAMTRRQASGEQPELEMARDLT
jgi:hypothetical protein